MITDIGFMTSDPDLGADVSELFNVLTGYSYKQEYRKLLVAPGLMRREVAERPLVTAVEWAACAERNGAQSVPSGGILGSASPASGPPGQGGAA